MLVGVMVTNGGAHPPEKLAAVTAGQIISIATGIEGTAAIEGRKLELKILEILEEVHKTVQNSERDELSKGKGHARLDDRLDVHAYIQPTVDKIVAAAATTIHKEHFENPEVLAHVYRVVGQQLTNNMHIERLWHADRNPDRPESQRYKTKFAGVSLAALAQA